MGSNHSTRQNSSKANICRVSLHAWKSTHTKAPSPSLQIPISAEISTKYYIAYAIGGKLYTSTSTDSSKNSKIHKFNIKFVSCSWILAQFFALYQFHKRTNNQGVSCVDFLQHAAESYTMCR
uniref:Uncharacterized protein n=1 Tax=Micrurus paraensis TaxID=1970185 RepID=A0A2D4KTK0_9SAUR